MKQLLILRHGKSDWQAGASNDHERPLNPRGRKAADKIGQFLASTDQTPDLVLSSTAVRARTTAERAQVAGHWNCTIELDETLYGASVGNVLQAASRVDDGIGRLLIAGHEPTSSSTVAQLTGAQVRFPTAGLACIALSIESWSALRPSSRGLHGELHWFVIPRLLA